MIEEQKDGEIPVDFVNQQTSAVSVKVPPFNKTDITIWLGQLEAQFRVAKVTQDSTKFFYITGNLPPETAAIVRDFVIKSDYEQGDYALLKQTLISEYTASASNRINRIINDAKIGEESPTEFLRSLIVTAGDAVPYTVVLEQFMSQMPKHIQAAVQHLANELAEKYRQTRVRNTQQEASMLRVIEPLWEREKKSTVAAVIDQKKRQPRARSLSRNRSRSPSHRRKVFNPNGALCYYHFRFGQEANKCERPSTCKFRLRSNNHRARNDLNSSTQA